MLRPPATTLQPTVGIKQPDHRYDTGRACSQDSRPGPSHVLGARFNYWEPPQKSATHRVVPRVLSLEDSSPGLGGVGQLGLSDLPVHDRQQLQREWVFR